MKEERTSIEWILERLATRSKICRGLVCADLPMGLPPAQ
jgi:hypothetical protein